MILGRNRIRTFSTSTLLLIASLLLISSRFYPPVAHFEDRWIHRVFTPLLSLFQHAPSVRSDSKNSVSSTDSSEVNRLKEALAKLQGENRELHVVKANYERLQKIHDLAEQYSFKTEMARVIGYDAIQGAKTILLNKGSSSGIKKGQAVFTTEGVVGVVHKTTPTDSTILLLIDSNSSVAGEVQPSRARGILKGFRKNLSLNREFWISRMEYLGLSDEIHEQDWVVSSGLDQIFPPGIPIGRIQQIHRDEKGLFASAEVVPAVDFSKLGEVLVVVGKEPVASKNKPESEPAKKVKSKKKKEKEK